MRHWAPSSRAPRGAVVVILMSVGLAASPAAAQDSWFVSFERESISPNIPRDDTSLFAEVGTLETDGFTDMVISIGGEFKDVVPESGTVGVLLIPDIHPFTYLLEQEGHVVFAIEAKVAVGAQTGAIFYSQPVEARIAFPAYRVYLYNETSSAANVSVYVYRTRR